MTLRSPPPAAAAGFDSEIEDLCRTLDRSRKRHLSVGLLRGDQVQDRLKQQEASASPHLKKTRTTILTPAQLVTPTKEAGAGARTMAMTMADFEAYMERNTNRRLSGIETGLTGLRSSVDKLESTVDNHDKTIKANQSNIADLKSEILKLKSGQAEFPALPARPNPFPTSASPGRAAATSRADLDTYATARRSLRLWPIPGTTVQQLWEAVRSFLTTNLALGTDVAEDDIEKIQRVAIPSGPAVRLEALVTFKDARTRDIAMGAAGKLAPFMDMNGRSTAGMRMEVPAFLQQHFRILFRYGQNLRTRHGPGTRRHVKFDDLEQGLFLNVRLPGDEQWSKVTVDMARRGLRAKEVQSADGLERRLDITGPATGDGRARASSVATMETDQARTQPQWTGRRHESSSS